MILDTNAPFAFIDGEAGVGDVLRRQARATLPVIVLGEFRACIVWSRHRTAYESWLDSHLTHFDAFTVATETTWIETTVAEWIEVHGDPPKPAGESDAAEEPAIVERPIRYGPARKAKATGMIATPRLRGVTGSGRPIPAAVLVHPRGGWCETGSREGFNGGQHL